MSVVLSGEFALDRVLAQKTSSLDAILNRKEPFGTECSNAMNGNRANKTYLLIISMFSSAIYGIPVFLTLCVRETLANAQKAAAANTSCVNRDGQVNVF